MFRVCMIFVTPHSAQLLSLTDPPPILTGQRRGCQCTGCPQGQSNRKDRNWKRIEGRDKVYGDSERRALPSSGRQQQVRRGPSGAIWVTCPPFLLFQPDKPTWGAGWNVRWCVMPISVSLSIMDDAVTFTALYAVRANYLRFIYSQRVRINWKTWAPSCDKINDFNFFSF